MKKLLGISARLVATLLLFALLLISASGVSPIYRFAAPAPFSGPDIFNPYASADSAMLWKRANFHTHTRVKGIFNECEYWPDAVFDSLARYGYDIVTFSNHNELTAHPFDTLLQVNVYEHGYNFLKYHKLVFGSDKVCRFDNLIPVFDSQRQFQMDLLGKDADIIQLNHPYRTAGTCERVMSRLTGYRLIELDSGIGTGQEYWDWALSAGHYSFALAGDDLHYPDRTSRIAVRCSFLNCRSASYEDILECLRDGCFYCMRIPDYGNGDRECKRRMNRELPAISEIGLDGNRIHIRVSRQADSIKVTGEGHRTLGLKCNVSELEYSVPDGEPYARITAFFPDGAVIYTNAFARYDAASADSPFVETEHPVNIPLTILFNLALLSISAALLYLMALVWKKRH